MTPAVEPVKVTVTFSAVNSADPIVTMDPGVTIGQLALAAWVLENQAADARRGQMIAQAQEAQMRQALASGIRNGGRG